MTTSPLEVPRPSGRRVRLVLIAIGAATALALGGFHVRTEYVDDDHVLLPEGCADLLPTDLAERLPGSGRVQVRGGTVEAEEEGVLQVAHCEAVGGADGDPAHFSLQVVLYDPNDHERVDRMREMVDEGRRAREARDFEAEYSDPPMRAVEWRSLSVGDGGYATASLPVEEGGGSGELWSSLEYSLDNVRVSLFHRTEDSVDPTEGLDALESLAVEVGERLADPAR